MPSAYEVLQVAVDADHDAIREAYRGLVRAFHPDRHPNDPQAHERFLAIQAAYEVLVDPDRRRAHDRDPDGVLDEALWHKRKDQLRRRKARLHRLFRE